jgi:hypothetical protein
LIARLNRTTRAGVRRLQRIIEAANGTIFGVVATGAPKQGGYDGYGYGYGYKDSRKRKRAERKHLRKGEATDDGRPAPARQR